MASNVHTTHCCVLHGCKYCDEDCPVANGLQEQEYSCDDCAPYMRTSKQHLYIDVDVYTHLSMRMGYQKSLVFKDGQNVEVGQILKVNLKSRENLVEDVKRVYKEFCRESYHEKDDIDYYENNIIFLLMGHISHIINVGNMKVASIKIEKSQN